MIVQSLSTRPQKCIDTEFENRKTEEELSNEIEMQALKMEEKRKTKEKHKHKKRTKRKNCELNFQRQLRIATRADKVNK